MNRMWEIREGETPEKDYGYSRNRRYMRSPMMTRQEMSEYDEGYEEGYRCAIEDVKKAIGKTYEK